LLRVEAGDQNAEGDREAEREHVRSPCRAEPIPAGKLDKRRRDHGSKHHQRSENQEQDRRPLAEEAPSGRRCPRPHRSGRPTGCCLPRAGTLGRSCRPVCGRRERPHRHVFHDRRVGSMKPRPTLIRGPVGGKPRCKRRTGGKYAIVPDNCAGLQPRRWQGDTRRMSELLGNEGPQSRPDRKRGQDEKPLADVPGPGHPARS